MNALESVKYHDNEVYTKLTEQHIDDYKLRSVTYLNNLTYENTGGLGASTRTTTVQTTVGRSSSSEINTSSMFRIAASASGSGWFMSASVETEYNYNFSETISYATSEEYFNEEVLSLDLSVPIYIYQRWIQIQF